MIGKTFAEIKVVYVENLPIIETEDYSVFDEIVNQILTLKSNNPAADTTALEAEIDQLVYALYGLTAEEIALVEG